MEAVANQSTMDRLRPILLATELIYNASANSNVFA